MIGPTPTDVLVDFATQINFSGHYYVSKNNNKFVLTEQKTDSQHLKDLIAEARKETGKQKEVSAAISIIKSHLENKVSGIFSLFINKTDKERIDALIVALGNEDAPSAPETEALARLQFYKELPQMLGVRNATQKDLEATKIISKKLWDHFENYEKYKTHMKMFFEGEHFLFEEANKFALYEELKVAQNSGAYLRGSSHYDHGTRNGKTGGPVPITEDNVSNPQYEIEGPQIKALLFGRVKLAEDKDGNLIFGKTYDDVPKEIRKKERKFTFLQTEWAPDSSSVFSANFWKHRIFSFVLYAARKTLGLETPNVGPYGYGHGDAKAPTVIPIKNAI